MNWVFLKIDEKPNFSFSPPPPPPSAAAAVDDSFSLENKVSPSILLIIIILSIIFFISGLLHLLVRFLLRPQNRDPDELDSVTALQGQLQQLFHLHDAGVDQSFIDTLPVFHYKAIIGLKNPFDCAVCLCEFEPDDKLRLLPKCSHAFHMECIDTWLLSHSTCPLCRASLIPDFNSNDGCSPIVLVLESGSESSREIVNCDRTNSNLGSCFGDELASSRFEFSSKSIEVLPKEDKITNPSVNLGNGEKVVTVKLGNFRNMDIGEGSSAATNSTIDERRCFSMGSFEYVMDENSRLQVPIRTPAKKQQSSKKLSNFPLTPGHRQAMSLCDCESRRFEPFNGFDPQRSDSVLKKDRNEISGGKRESFSISKIWLRGKKDNDTEDSSRRAFSFRFPVLGSSSDESKSKNLNGDGRRTLSEIGIARWENRSSVLTCDEESQISLDYSQAKTPSFARRTLLWLTGKQNKVLHSSNPSDV